MASKVGGGGGATIRDWRNQGERCSENKDLERHNRLVALPWVAERAGTTSPLVRRKTPRKHGQLKED